MVFLVRVNNAFLLTENTTGESEGRGQRPQPDLAQAQTSITVDPVVSRASRARCASAMSSSLKR